MNEMLELYHGDCIDVMQQLIDKGVQVDLTVTSPPYDNIRNYKDTCEWNFDIFKQVANKLYDITKKGGVVVWVVGDSTVNGSETGTSFKQALYFKEIGFNLHDTMIYMKNNPVPIGGNKRYYQSFDYMFVFSNGVPKTFNPKMVERKNKCNDKRTHRVKSFNRDKDGEFHKKYYEIKEIVKSTNIWDYYVGGGNSSKDMSIFKHPAVFPEKLAEDHILSWSNDGDLVLDPFMGSGTTGKMAILNNRNFIGIEKVEEYYNLSVERINKFKKN